MGEVYFSVQFSEAVSDEAFALADFWPQIREEFPGLERHPPVAPIDERFEVPLQGSPQIGFEFSTGPPPQRYWFISEDGARLVQVQPDRFFFNWRRTSESDEYPRFRNLLPNFEATYLQFTNLAAEARGSSPEPTWCEVGYINHIEARGDEDPQRHLPLHRILRLVTAPEAAALDPIEDMQVQLRSIMRNADEAPVGRMYLSAVPAYRAADQAPIYVMELTVRARPTGATLDDVLALAGRAREMIVTAFRDATTTEMHARWGLENGQ